MATLREIKEMIDQLVDEQGEDVLDMESYTEYDYGDYCHTRAITEMNTIKVTRPINTAYSSSGLAVSEDEEDINHDEFQEHVVVFS